MAHARLPASYPDRPYNSETYALSALNILDHKSEQRNLPGTRQIAYIPYLDEFQETGGTRHFRRPPSLRLATADKLTPSKTEPEHNKRALISNP
jgi:hypothetical protein